MKREREWFGASGDAGRYGGGRDVQAKLEQHETAAAVSSIRSKLSRPKDKFSMGSSSSGGEAARKTKLSREEILANQQAHKERLEAKGQAVPYYRKH